MREVSVFCDESGGENGHSRYCIIALVFHEQGKSFDGALVRYRRALRDASLEDVPFHASPLMYGKGDYAGMSLEGRKGLFMSFFILQKALPYRFKVFSYRRSEVSEPEKFTVRLQKDLADFLCAMELAALKFAAH